MFIFEPMAPAVAVKQKYNFQCKQQLKNQILCALHLQRIDLIMRGEKSS